MHGRKSALMNVTLLLLVAFAPGCLEPAKDEPSTWYVLLIDQSRSVGAEQADRWLDAAKEMVFDRLTFGDGVTIFGLHDVTGRSAPLFDERIPAINSGGMPAELPARRKLESVRVQGLSVARDALHTPVRANGTRILESLSRLSCGRDRRAEVVILSDMLESTRELNLERTAITDRNIEPLATEAVQRLRLDRGVLGEVTVYCVLESAEIGGKSGSRNDPLTLERFWRLVFDYAGASLESFDSRIPSRRWQ